MRVRSYRAVLAPHPWRLRGSSTLTRLKSRAFHDSCGQVVGDTVLKALAKMLRMHMAASMVARIGGAEFIFFGDMKAEEVFCPYQTTS
ncbi:predicted protein [Brucella sp. NVSL 07-0026]|nr:predicted protein [Brucella sp. NVSL 07-0026]